MSRLLRRNLPLRRSAPFIYVDLTSDSEDDHPDEEECPELDLLREAMYLEAAYITSDEDESQDET